MIREEKGFTLIEILIGIALLAILAALVVPNVTGFTGRGITEAYKSEKKAIQAAVDAYYTDPANRVNAVRQYPTGSGSRSDDPGYGYSSNSSYISFAKLVDQSLLGSTPESAAPVQNGDATFTGGYGWYVDSKGRVTSSPAFNNTFP